MKKILICFILLFSSNLLHSQIKQFDKLEMLYDQQHYKLVYKKSLKLLDNPAYDFSLIPIYYKSLSMFQLSQDEFWLKRNPNSLIEASSILRKIKNSSDGKKILHAHFYEIVALKRDLINCLEDLKRSDDKQTFEDVQEILSELFSDVPDIENEDTKSGSEITLNSKFSTESSSSKEKREKLISTALRHIGTPYSFSGDSPKGFDCSGFTSYIYKQIELKIPRSAKEQFEKCEIIKQKTLSKGDLIFFSNGTFISHVGIIVSDKDEPLVMIHASSTKGIVVTEVEKSSYWMKKIAGFGKFIH